MSVLERVYKIERILKSGEAVSMQELQTVLEASRATIKRDLDYVRDRLNAPIVWDRKLRGYRLEGEHSLPSLYLSHAEIQALFILHHLVARIHPAVAWHELEPIRALLPELAPGGVGSAQELERRVRILPVRSRLVNAEIFELVTAAVLARRRVEIRYRSRSRGEVATRMVSPMRLVHYRDNWYLDAWCHVRLGLRSFSVDSILSARGTNEVAEEIADEDLDRELGSGYGIFAGSLIRTAVLRFSSRAARWVSEERWHANQVGHYEADGSYLLRLPYSRAEELIQDILKFGPEVQVIDPKELISDVKARLESTLQNYCD